MKWFLEVFQKSGSLSLNILAKSASLVLKGIGKLTGGGFLEQVAEFVTQLNDLFGGFKERARSVAADLRGDDVAYVLVTTPAPMSIQEVLFFSERLEQQGMHRDVFVVNRVHQAPHARSTEAQAQEAIDQLGLHLDEVDGASRLVSALDDETRQAELDASHLLRLQMALSEMAPKPLRLDVPALPYDVHDLKTLAEVAAVLRG
jgi:anion-transporting  ArsA/GET3 family ATPase